MSDFRTPFGQTIFDQKYARFPGETWAHRAHEVTEAVVHGLVPVDVEEAIEEAIARQEFLPGGRYLYYGGRGARFFNNCNLLRLEDDTREAWGALVNRAMSCLMSGAGVGADYTLARPEDSHLSRTGGRASGPVPLIEIVNEAGRRVMQGGSRRSALWAGLNWRHADIRRFIHAKDWGSMRLPGGVTVADMKRQNFDYHAPLDMTNMTVNLDDHWMAYMTRDMGAAEVEVFYEALSMALRTAEPGFGFNFGAKTNETLRNACTEVTSEDDSDVCNLGSINLARVESIDRFRELVRLATVFLLCGTVRAEVPYEKVAEVRAKNRRLGLGLMGVHEWLLRRGYRYEMTEELRRWMEVYRDASQSAGMAEADRLGLSHPVAFRGIAPTGTIGILAGTTTGLEPLFAAAYKRRYLKGTEWYYQMVVDGTTQLLVNEGGLDPDRIETALSLAEDVERRIAFQADMQDYVDQGISSTINLPAWGSALNNADRVQDFAKVIVKYAPRLRGLTFYPDGARGGQPLTMVPYKEALAAGSGAVAETADICEISGKGGTCGS